MRTKAELQIEIDKILDDEKTTYPVEIVKIANNLGYKVYDFGNDLDGEIASKVSYDEKYIYVRPSDTFARKRFTIAYEIAHIVLHPTTNFQSIRTNSSFYIYNDNIEDIEANRFAAMLLMPEFEFKKQWGRHNGVTKNIAEYFCVPTLIVRIRAHDLKLLF